MHNVEDSYTKIDVLRVAFAIHKIQLHLEDEYVMLKVVKIRKVNPAMVTKKLKLSFMIFKFHKF